VLIKVNDKFGDDIVIYNSMEKYKDELKDRHTADVKKVGALSFL